MKRAISFGKLDVNLVSSLEEVLRERKPDTPFRMLIVGNFSGNREARGVKRSGKAGRSPISVDRDDLDEVMAGLGVELQLPIFGKDSPFVAIGFSELEDFHPDRLFDRLEVFQTLKDVRRSLKYPAAASSFADRLVKKEIGDQSSRANEGSIVQSVSSQTAGSLLDEILDGSAGDKPSRPSPAPTSAWESFLHDIVAPHLVADIEPEQQEVMAATESAMGELMRKIIHHPDFQELEANWRGLDFLTSRIETDESLQLLLLDVSKADLAKDLVEHDDLAATGLYRLLVQDPKESDEEPWGAIAGLYTFGASLEDVELLGRISKIAAQAGAPFISAASPHLLGCEALSKTPDPRDWEQRSESDVIAAWEALRALSEARHIGLALPRFLLRLPYGARTEPIERFDFEEMAEPIEHEHYLWGNPAFACMYLLARAFAEDGWDLEPGSVQEVEDLPLHVVRRQGESVITPCAEVLLTHRAAEALLDAGFIPLLSFMNQDFIRVARFQSISDATEPLRGGWKG